MPHQITIVGLGNHSLDDLPLGLYKFLTQHTHLYTRTLDHPVVESLQSEGLKFQSFDEVYEAHEDFEAVYENIVTQLIEAAHKEDVIYTVPGHPRVAETTTTKLELYAKQHSDVEVKVLGGKSFIDDVFEAVKVDPNDGFALLDATNIHEDQINIRNHTLITQVYSHLVAGDLKVTLMERFNDEHEVYIVSGAHHSGSQLIQLPLYELDRDDSVFNNLTSVFVPKAQSEKDYYSDFYYAASIMDRLVDDETGCPWDKVQTHESLKRYLLEETFELFEAIDNEDDWHMIEELGDVLLQVLLHASIGKKEGYFDINEIIHSFSDKMIRRHPHIFGEADAQNMEDLENIWSTAKAKEGKVERVKFEKVFAEHFLKLYDETKNMPLNETELKRKLERGGHETCD